MLTDLLKHLRSARRFENRLELYDSMCWSSQVLTL